MRSETRTHREGSLQPSQVRTLALCPHMGCVCRVPYTGAGQQKQNEQPTPLHTAITAVLTHFRGVMGASTSSNTPAQSLTYSHIHGGKKRKQQETDTYTDFRIVLQLLSTQEPYTSTCGALRVVKLGETVSCSVPLTDGVCAVSAHSLAGSAVSVTRTHSDTVTDAHVQGGSKHTYLYVCVGVSDCKVVFRV